MVYKMLNVIALGVSDEILRGYKDSGVNQGD